MNFTVLRFDSVDSTNLEALRQARLGADAGLCIIADQQTAGRGRQGRTWSSPKGSGLYCSIMVRPRLEPRRLPIITLAAAVAVYDALTELGIICDIKWPNDILVNEKKICGILAETAETATGLAVIVGIGINLTSKNFPDTLVGLATSVEAELGRVQPALIEESLIKYFGFHYDRLVDAGPAEVLEEWRRRSSYFGGKRVRVTQHNITIEGFTDGLDENGGLLIKTDLGEIVSVQAGDVERLRTTE